MIEKRTREERLKKETKATRARGRHAPAIDRQYAAVAEPATWRRRTRGLGDGVRGGDRAGVGDESRSAGAAGRD